jgi:hypothetical protein
MRDAASLASDPARSLITKAADGLAEDNILQRVRYYRAAFGCPREILLIGGAVR